MEKTNNEFFDDVISLLETCKNNMVNAYSERKGEDATKDMMKMYGVVMPLVDLLAIKHPEFYSGLYGKKTELMFFMNAARIYKSYPAFYNAISALPSKNHILKNSKIHSEEDKELYAYYLEMYEAGKKLFALLKEKEVRELIELVIDYSLEVNDVIMEARTADKDLASKTYVLEKLSK